MKMLLSRVRFALLALATAAAGCGHAAIPTTPTTTALTIKSVAPTTVIVGSPQAFVVTGSSFSQGLTVAITATTAPTVGGPPVVGTISNVTSTSFEVMVTFPYAGGYSMAVTSGGQKSEPFAFDVKYACPPIVYSLSGPTIVLVGETITWTVGFELCPGPMFESGIMAALSSQNPSVATVDSLGRITGVAPGVARIQWGYGSPTSGIQAVTVLDAPPGVVSSLSIRNGSTLPMHKDQTQQLDAIASFSGGSTTVTHHAQWTSSDPSIVSVADGLVTARAIGSADITASYQSASATFKIKVQ